MSVKPTKKAGFKLRLVLELDILGSVDVDVFWHRNCRVRPRNFAAFAGATVAGGAKGRSSPGQCAVSAASLRKSPEGFAANLDQPGPVEAKA